MIPIQLFPSNKINERMMSYNTENLGLDPIAIVGIGELLAPHSILCTR